MKMLRSVELSKKIYDKLLNEVAKKNNLTLNELKILIFLNNNMENNIAKNIVDGLSTTKSHVSLSVSNLEKKGYIEKDKDETNKKKNHLKPTKKSSKIIEEGNRVQEEIKEVMLNGITEDEIKFLVRVSDKIKDNLEKYNETIQ